LSARVTPRVLHLTGSGRLWMARKRLLLLGRGDKSDAAASAADGEHGVLDSSTDLVPARALERAEVGTPAAVRDG
jgi:hypothetical protein